MQLKLKQNLETDDVKVTIEYKNLDTKVKRLASQIRLYDKTLTVSKEKDTIFIDASEVMYFDSVDDNVYAITEKETFKTDLKLYEIEEIFKNTDFIRINKSVIVNISKIKRLCPLLNSKIQAIFSTGEKQIITRTYAKNFKKKLGL